MNKIIFTCLLFCLYVNLFGQSKQSVFFEKDFSFVKDKSGVGYIIKNPLGNIDSTCNYANYFRTIYNKVSSKFELNENIKLKDNDLISGAYMALKLYQKYGDDSYLNYGEKAFDLYMSRQNNSKFNFDMFSAYPLFNSAILLQKNRRFSPQREQFILETVNKNLKFNSSCLRFGNRELGFQLGNVIVAWQLYPEKDECIKFRKIWQQWWLGFKAIGALDENSGNYSSLGLVELINILKITGNIDDLKTDSWKELFTSYAKLVTPSGNMPEFGDDYFEHGGKIAWIQLFEFASKFYNNPEFGVVAHKLFYRKQLYTNNHRLTPMFLDDLDLIDETPDFRQKESNEKTCITYRNNSLGVRTIYNLILRPNSKQGSPYLMFDLYGLGDHAHMEKRGSILNYEVGNVLLLHGFYRHEGRQTYDGGNGISVLQYGNKFPFWSWPEGSPLTVSLGTERLGVSSNNSNLNTIRGFSSVNTERNGSIVKMNNLRLSGNSGDKVIDKSEKIFQPSDRFQIKDINVEFNPNEFSSFKYDLIYNGGKEPKLDLRYSDDSRNMYNAWHGTGEYRMPMQVKLNDAKVDTKMGDSFGWIDFSEFYSVDSKYKRSIILTKEGIIVMREDYLPGASINGWTGGLTWQFYSMEKAGRNYFASKVDVAYSCSPTDKKQYNRGTLAVFDLSKNDITGVGYEERGGRQSPKFTYFSKFTLKANCREVRTTVIIPYEKNDDIDKIAKSVQFKTETSKSQATLTWGKTTYSIIINDNQVWSVDRINSK